MVLTIHSYIGETGFFKGLLSRLFSQKTVNLTFYDRATRVWSVHVDCLILVFACVNMGFCLDGKVEYGEC